MCLLQEAPLPIVKGSILPLVLSLASHPNAAPQKSPPGATLFSRDHTCHPARRTDQLLGMASAGQEAAAERTSWALPVKTAIALGTKDGSFP